MEVHSDRVANQKNEMFMRSIESEVEELNRTLQNTYTQLTRTNQELKMIKWCMFIVVIMVGLTAVRFGVF